MIKSHFRVCVFTKGSLPEARIDPRLGIGPQLSQSARHNKKQTNAYFKNSHARNFSLNQYNGLGKQKNQQLGMLRTFSTHNM